jgi:hypothetical protein
VTRDTILLLDSGAQFLDGTTDVTRTVGESTRACHASPSCLCMSMPAVAWGLASVADETEGLLCGVQVHFGDPTDEEKTAFTLVLKGGLACPRTEMHTWQRHTHIPGIQGALCGHDKTHAHSPTHPQATLH